MKKEVKELSEEDILKELNKKEKKRSNSNSNRSSQPKAKFLGGENHNIVEKFGNDPKLLEKIQNSYFKNRK